MSGAERSALLVARQTVRRRSIAVALERQGMSVVGESAGPDGALPMLEQCDPAVLVVELDPDTGDTELKRRNQEVLAFVRAARARVPDLRVIAVTQVLDAQLMADADSTGVDAYLLASGAE